jgi:hypothetical protein
MEGTARFISPQKIHCIHLTAPEVQTRNGGYLAPSTTKLQGSKSRLMEQHSTKLKHDLFMWLSVDTGIYLREERNPQLLLQIVNFHLPSLA